WAAQLFVNGVEAWVVAFASHRRDGEAPCGQDGGHPLPWTEMRGDVDDALTSRERIAEHLARCIGQFECSLGSLVGIEERNRIREVFAQSAKVVSNEFRALPLVPIRKAERDVGASAVAGRREELVQEEP